MRNVVVDNSSAALPHISIGHTFYDSSIVDIVEILSCPIELNWTFCGFEFPLPTNKSLNYQIVFQITTENLMPVWIDDVSVTHVNEQNAKKEELRCKRTLFNFLPYGYYISFFFIRFLHISSCIYWNFDDIFSMFSCNYIKYKLYHTLFGYFIFYKIIIYNNCQFGTYGKHFHLKSCFWCYVVLNFP